MVLVKPKTSGSARPLQRWSRRNLRSWPPDKSDEEIAVSGRYEGVGTMSEHQNAELQWLLGEPTPLHHLREQVTLVKGWTQLVARYSMEEGPRHEADIRKGLTRIDAATTHLTELLTQVQISTRPPYLAESA
jgi:hypothetical protein